MNNNYQSLTNNAMGMTASFGKFNMNDLEISAKRI